MDFIADDLNCQNFIGSLLQTGRSRAFLFPYRDLGQGSRDGRTHRFRIRVGNLIPGNRDGRGPGAGLGRDRSGLQGRWDLLGFRRAFPPG